MKFAVLIQVLGTVLVFIGSFLSSSLFALGLMLLLPGSLFAGILPWLLRLTHLYDYEIFHILLLDILYLPAALAFNAICLIIAKRVSERHTVVPATGGNAVGKAE